MAGSVCQRCGKNAATIHLTDILKPGGERRERHLCEECAIDEGVTAKAHTPINELLTNFLMVQAGAQELAQLSCDQCGMTFVEFRNRGLLGCPNDYVVFAKALGPLIERAHEGGTQHVGKIPSRFGGTMKQQQELAKLRQELNAAIEREDYEEAAKLRDRIRSTEAS